jgi:hypothetical protein
LSNSNTEVEFGKIFNGIELVEDNPDFYVIFGSTYDTTQYYDKNKTILFQYEPLPYRNMVPVKEFEERNIVNDDVLGKYSIPKFRSVFPSCHINMSHFNIARYNFSLLKTKNMSAVISGKQDLEGQIKRKLFITNALSKFSDIDIYGRDFYNIHNYKGSLINKEDGLINYKYHFSAENYYENNYYTEKLTDAILCECLCFYCGCPNIENFVDPMAYIKIDLSDFGKTIETISKAIRDSEYEKRLPFIKKAKEKLLKDDNTFNIIRRIIEAN